MSKRIIPILKWVGGKTQILDEIMKKIPKQFNTYYEPFFGGGALLFAMEPNKAVINDINTELINFYKVVKSQPNKLIKDLTRHINDSDYFYSVRELDRNHKYLELGDVERASRFHYLNKTAYSGIYRVNQKGQFNTPFGNYVKPNIVNSEKILIVSEYLQDNDVKILNTDFTSALDGIKENDFVYFDPPYDVEENVSKFTGYTNGGFNKENQLKLKRLCDSLTEKGVYFLLSNSNTKFIRELYKNYDINIVKVNRHINSNSKARKKSAEEVLIKNY